jgi:hypothetical protein
MTKTDALERALAELPEEERFLAREFFRRHWRVNGRWVRCDESPTAKDRD